MTSAKRKKAIITGASRGLGRSSALLLAKSGIDLALISRGKEDLESLKKEVEAHKVACSIFTADLSEPASVKAVVTEVKSGFGETDIIVHNAGGSLQVSDPFSSAEVWQKVWYFNVGSGIEFNNAFITGMSSSGWGRIVHVASASIFTYGGNAPYVAAKSALLAYIKSLSRTVAKQGIVVSGVAPGPIRVPGRYLAKIADENGKEWEDYCKNHLAIAKLATPDEIASAVAYLCSDGASYAVGTIIGMDGGTT